MIDLHTHSTFSDGFLTPRELFNQAQQLNLEALALTDHDTVAGLKELHQAARNKKIEILNAAEMAVYYPHTDMEIIAMDIPKQSLQAYLDYQNSEINRRKELTYKRIELLQKSGFNITYEEVAYDEHGNLRTQIRRPHFTDIMLKKGYIKDIEEAYKGVFARGGSCYVENKPLSAKDMIKFIKDTGAKAIMAHPIHTDHSGDKLYKLVKKLQHYGLDGIEVFHSSQTKQNRLEYLNIIDDLHLITSGGSDFHGGTAHPENKLGTGKNNNLNIPYLVLEIIKEIKKPSASYYKELLKYL